MDLHVVQLQQVVPPRRPLHRRLLPHDGVGEEQRSVAIAVDSLWFWVVGEVALFALELDLVEVHGQRLNLESNNSILIPERDLLEFMDV
jgi:hypothetical protein